MNVGPTFFRGPVGPSDSYFAFVAGLYHFDGNKLNTIGTAGTDLGFAGSAVTSNAQFRWGTEALALTGAAGQFARAEGTVFDWEFDVGDFAIEFWFRSALANQLSNIVDLRNNTASQWNPVFYVTATNYFAWFANGVERRATAASSIATNTWYFGALARASSVTRFYLGTSGTAAQVGADFADANDYTPVTGGFLTVGAAINDGARFTGAVDDLRITIGSARGYTGATIPIPTAAFEDQ